MSITTLRTSLRLALGAAVVGVLAISFTAQFASGGLTGQILNSANTTASGTLLYTHTYGTNTCSSVPVSGAILADSSFNCSGSIAPTSPTPASGSVSATDAIAYRGSAAAASVTQRVSAASCGAVSLANNIAATNPLLARYGTSFSPTTGPMGNTAGSITLDGANPGGSETNVVQDSLTPPGILNNVTYGYGIWFKAAAGSAGGSLFGFGDSPGNVAGTNDRILALTSAGRLSYVFNTQGTTISTAAGTDYRDGAWHFVYVRTVNSFLGAETANIYLDGATAAVATNNNVAGGYSSYNGYWHVGWSPVSSGSAYFAGSLSNFVTFDSNPAPAAPTSAQIATQTTFNTWSGGAATARYPMNDLGTTTFSGTMPVLGATSPCATVNVSWGFTSPTSCAYAPNSQTATCTDPPNSSLAGFANGTARAIASPAPGTTQASTIKIARGTGYSTAFEPGLRLYTPLTFTASVGGWTNTFIWNDAGAVFLA